MVINVILKFIVTHPAMALITGGILLLVLSPMHDPFELYGWTLIIIGVMLQLIWLFLFRRV
jgi:hypothetical protein